MKTVLLLIIVIGTKFCVSQNLVPNSSFEEYINCPTGMAQLNKTNYWTSPNAGSPDYFNSCNLGNVGVPTNIGGFQYAHFGNAYSGIVVFFKYVSNYREYIQVELNTPLEFNKTYLINFFVSLRDSNNYAIRNIGILFSNEEITNGSFENLNYLPQFEYNKYIIDKENWTQINCNYIANGGEKYLIIGNFKPDSLTDTLFVSNFIANSSYYYIDDVSVTLDTTVGTNEELTVKSEEYKIYPNPNTGTINISSNKNFEPINLEIYSSLGQKVYIKSFNNCAIAKNIELNLPNGIYYCILRKENKIVFNQKIVVQN